MKEDYLFYEPDAFLHLLAHTHWKWSGGPGRAKDALLRLANQIAQVAEKGKTEMCKQKPVYVVPNTATFGCSTDVVPGVWITGNTDCTCGKNTANESLDYTRDEFRRLMNMLVSIRDYINQVIDQIDHGTNSTDDTDALRMAYTMEKQLLQSLQSYVTDATQ